MPFVALVDFWSEDLRSGYVAGLSYTAYDDDDHRRLRELLPQWVKEGKVSLGGPASGVRGG